MVRTLPGPTRPRGATRPLGRVLGTFCLLGTACLAGAALAQQPPGPQDAAPASAEPPAVVGRIAEISGSVSHKAASASEWEKAERNWPIVAGDAIYAAADGRARLEIGGASVTVRPGAVVDLAALDDRSVSLRADSGSASIVTAAGGEPFAVLTPRGSASLGPDGVYRVSAGDETAPTEIAVCRGGATLADGQTRLREGEMAMLSGDASAPQIRVAAAPSGGCGAEPMPEARLPQKVSRRMTGIRDLADHGRWSRTPEGGDVWFPNVGEDWAPYRDGRWSWVAPWGWTWVDDAPWGFAPFHYGRWAELDGRWGWLPGEPVERPVYAPAMVAFIDPPPDAVEGPDPAFGWVPLGPGEIYRPYYPTPGIDYARRVNLNIVGVTGATIGALIAAPLAVAALRNRRAVTVVPVAVVNGGRPVAPALLPTKPQILASAPVRPAGKPVMPRAPGAPRMPPVPGRPAAAPPRPLPPLAARPVPPALRPAGPAGGAGGPRGPMPLTPPVVAPGRVPPSPKAMPSVAGRPPAAGRPPVAGPRSMPAGPAFTGPKTGGPKPALRQPGPAAPPVRTAPVSHPAPVARHMPAARPMPMARPTQPMARPMPAPVARSAPMARPAPPVARAMPAPMARSAPMARPAPPRAAPHPAAPKKPPH